MPSTRPTLNPIHGRLNIGTQIRDHWELPDLMNAEWNGRETIRQNLRAFIDTGCYRGEIKGRLCWSL
jgi:hypothetical protein